LAHIGDKNPMWKGGVTPENHVIRSSAAYRKWKNAVLATDNNKCSYCGSAENLEAHHIDLFSKNRTARFDADNGITLCHECHRNVHSFDSTPFIQSYAYGVV
jgi:5-methylcytosine-specific restriction endonuclease McrA